jgi:serine/threonine protein phosphatase 1
MGNHEYYYIQYIKKGMYKEKILKYGLETTFKDFDMSFDNIKEKLYLPYRAIFDNLKFFYETDEYFISHAGISLDSVDKDFNILSADKFLFNRYGFLNYKKKIHNKISIFGHTGFNYPYYDGYKIGVDTSAVYTKENRLTAYCLEEKFFINNKNEKLYLKNIKIDRTPWINRIEPYRMEKKK